MPFQYRCDVCKTTSPTIPDRDALAVERKRHRDQFHGGHTPDGEQELKVRSGHPLWSTKPVLLAVAALLIANWLWQLAH